MIFFCFVSRLLLYLIRDLLPKSRVWVNHFGAVRQLLTRPRFGASNDPFPKPTPVRSTQIEGSNGRETKRVFIETGLSTLLCVANVN